MTDIVNGQNLPPEILKVGLQELINLFKKSSGKLKKLFEKRIKFLVKSKKYLISLSDKEVSELYKITKQELYGRVEKCLVSHWSMNLIALGVLISKLNELDQREIVERIKTEVHSKYMARGIRIVEMGSTGVISHIIEYLSDVKMEKNYNFIEMGKLFDGIIDQWDDITVFVKAEHGKEDVKTRCLDHLEKREILFFVFAYGSAVNATITAIAELSNENQLSGYIWDAKMKREGVKEVYSCTFQNAEGHGIDKFA